MKNVAVERDVFLRGSCSRLYGNFCLMYSGFEE